MWQFFKKLNRSDFKEFMAFYTITLSFLFMFCIVFIPVPEASQRFADVILGSLLTLVLGKVLGEYFDAKVKKKNDGTDEEGPSIY